MSSSGAKTSKTGPFPSTLALSSLDGSDGFRLDGGTTRENTGRAVSGAGDINGDGVEDVIIGAGFSGGGRGYVVFGRDTEAVGDFPASLALSNLDGQTGFRMNSISGWNTASVSSAGDLNGDGIDDLAIGSRTINNFGRSYVVFGRDTSTAGAFSPNLQLDTLTGLDGFIINDNPGVSFNGHVVGAAGDFDGDGNDDLVLGTFGSSWNGPSSGSGYLIFGRDTATEPPFPGQLDLTDLDGLNGLRLDGSSGDGAGTSVAGAADINGDGLADLVIGAPNATVDSTLTGRTYVLFGQRAVVLETDQDAVDFGTVLLSSPPTTASVTLTNRSARSVLLDSLSITGSTAFSLSNDQCSRQPLGTLTDINDQCTFDVQLDVAVTGEFTAQLVVPYDSAQSPLTMELRAVGVNADAVFRDRFKP